MIKGAIMSLSEWVDVRMRIKRSLALMLCAALVMVGGGFAAPQAAKADPFNSGIWLGGVQLQSETGKTLYYRYAEHSDGTTTIDPATPTDYNISIWRKYNASDSPHILTLNNLTVTRAYTLNNEQMGLYTGNPLEIRLLGDSYIQAPDISGEWQTSIGIRVNDFSSALYTLTLSGPGTLTAKGGAVASSSTSGSYGIKTSSLCVKSGTIIATGSGGGATYSSCGIMLQNGLKIESGCVTATAGTATYDSTGIRYLHGGDKTLRVTNGELIAQGATSGIILTNDTFSADFGSNNWYEWKSNTAPSEPSGDYTKSTTTPYTYADTQKYVRIRPMVSFAPISLDFGTAAEGYSPISSRNVTITNNSDYDTVLSVTAPASFVFADVATQVSVAKGAALPCAVHPVDGLAVGEYNEVIAVGDAVIPVHFIVTAVAPTINTPPANQTVVQGQTATFSVAASGTAPLTYLWQVSTDSGASWANAPGTNNASTYSLANVQNSMNGNQYRCTVSNVTGSVNAAATLTVNVPPSISGPNSLSLPEGYSDTRHNLTVTGRPTPTVTTDNTYGNKITWVGGTSDICIHPGLAAGAYPVILTASNGVDPNAQFTFTLTITQAPGISGDTAKTLPVGYAATSTNAYTLTGYPAPSVAVTGNAAFTWNDTTKKLDIAAGLPAGEYRATLTASNRVDPDAQCTFTLSVGDLAVTIDPATRTIYADTPVTLTATPASMVSPTFQWFTNSTASTTGATPLTGEVNATYAFTQASGGTRYYFCQALASGVTVTSNIVEIAAKDHLRFAHDTSFDVPAGIAGTAIASIDVSRGAAGGTTPYLFGFEGAAPTWLSISRAGVITGTRPTTAQAATTATVKVTDSAHPAESKTITLSIGKVSPSVKPPVTGDRFTPALWGMLALLCGAGIALLWRARRRASHASK